MSTIRAGLRMAGEREEPITVDFHMTRGGMEVSADVIEIGAWGRGAYRVRRRGDEVVIEAEGARLVASRMDVGRFMEMFA